MVRRLRDADDLLAPAVAKTIEQLELADEDAGAVRLARRYAATIDQAAQLAADLADLEPEDNSSAKRIHALAKAVEAKGVLAELGPKLLACLEQLGATPVARSRMKGGKPGGGTNRLEGLRQARRA